MLFSSGYFPIGFLIVRRQTSPSLDSRTTQRQVEYRSATLSELSHSEAPLASTRRERRLFVRRVGAGAGAVCRHHEAVSALND